MHKLGLQGSKALHHEDLSPQKLKQKLPRNTKLAKLKDPSELVQLVTKSFGTSFFTRARPSFELVQRVHTPFLGVPQLSPPIGGADTPPASST